jgi:tRNA threonylcarbamoyladenosine biosynthesis protein TsaE
MATCISRSPEETAALGERWGQEAQPGWVIGLSGELGAGKTQLVKGLARGLGFPGRVHSPTFALVNTYSGGRLPLVHLDLYRLETANQIAAVGLEELLRDGTGVTVIEWAERWFGRGGSPEPGPLGVQPFVAGATKGCTSEFRVPRRAGKIAEAFLEPTRLELPARWRSVQIEPLSETDRRIVYEDLGP